MPVFYPKKKSKHLSNPQKYFQTEGSKAKTLKKFQSNQTFMKTFRHSLVQHCRKNYLASAFNKRRNKLLHITQENKKIYDRINSQKTFYSTKKLNRSYEQSQKSSKSTSRFRKGKCQKLSSSTSTQKQDLNPRVTKKQRMYKLQVENIDHLRKQELSKFNRIFNNDKGGQVKYVKKRKQHLNKNYCTFQLKCPLGQIKNTLKCLTARNCSGAKKSRYHFQNVGDEEKSRRMQFFKV